MTGRAGSFQGGEEEWKEKVFWTLTEVSEVVRSGWGRGHLLSQRELSNPMPVWGSFHTHTHTHTHTHHMYSHTPASSNIHTHTCTLIHTPSHLPSLPAVSLRLCLDSSLLRAPSTPIGFSFLSHSGSLSVLLACLLFSWPFPLCPSPCLCLSPLSPFPSSCYHSFSPSLPFSELGLLSGALSCPISQHLWTSPSVSLTLSPVCGYILSPHTPQAGWTMRVGNVQLSSPSEPDNLDLSPLSQPSRPLCFLAGEALGGPAWVLPSPHHPVGMGQTPPFSDADG